LPGLATPKPFGTFLETELPDTEDWICDGFLPRGGTMTIAAAPKVGKSFVSLEMSRALITAQAPFECPALSVPEPARVLYIEDEVKEKGLQTRGRLIFKGISTETLNTRMSILSGVPEIRFDDPHGWKLLRDALKEVEPNVLILDPYGRFIGGLDENRNDEMGKVLSKLDQIVKDYAHQEMSLILVHHCKKPDTSANSKYDPLSPHSMRGASRMYANPDSILMLDRTKEYRNREGRKAWEITGHAETRQAEGLSDFVCTMNDQSDLRVRFKTWKGEGLQEQKKKEQSITPPPLKLLGAQGKLFTGFAEAEPAPYKGRG
jgi:RecA-family ATPase